MPGTTSMSRAGSANSEEAQRIGKYLGRGSSAVVHMVERESLKADGRQGNEKLARKSIHPELLSDESTVQSFWQEVDLLAELKHKSIVDFYGTHDRSPDSDEEAPYSGGRPAAPRETPALPANGQELYLLQEYMAGGTLNALVLRAMGSPMGNKVYSDADALRWALQIAEALEYLHSQEPKVIHRDLKLENILLSHTKPALANAKLADFGLARRLPGFGKEACTTEEVPVALPMPTNPKIHVPPNLTAKTGSMGYMAPEVLQGKPYNEKADVFSFAIILYNLFHRDIPTVHVTLNGETEDLEAYAHQVAHGYRPPIKPYVHSGPAALIERCWKGMPELRPTMAEVAAALRQMQAEAAASASAGGAKASRSKSKKGGCTIM